MREADYCEGEAKHSGQKNASEDEHDDKSQAVHLAHLHIMNGIIMKLCATTITAAAERLMYETEGTPIRRSLSLLDDMYPHKIDQVVRRKGMGRTVV